MASDKLKQRLKGGSKIKKKDKARSLKGLDEVSSCIDGNSKYFLKYCFTITKTILLF